MSRHPRRPPDDTDPEEGFLSRWSKRKEQVWSEPESGIMEELPVETSDPEVDEPGPDDIQPEKCDADMPPLESIDENSNVSEFFSPGVSETLRKAALRKLFHSPAFNIVDGLDDYDDDFTSFEALGNIITSDMRHQEELAEERRKEEEALEVEETAGEDSDLAEESSESETGEEDRPEEIQGEEQRAQIDEPSSQDDQESEKEEENQKA